MRNVIFFSSWMRSVFYSKVVAACEMFFFLKRLFYEKSSCYLTNWIRKTDELDEEISQVVHFSQSVFFFKLDENHSGAAWEKFFSQMRCFLLQGGGCMWNFFFSDEKCFLLQGGGCMWNFFFLSSWIKCFFSNLEINSKKTKKQIGSEKC